MEPRNAVSFCLGCVAASFFVSFFYLYTTHIHLLEMKKDIRDLQHYSRDIHKASSYIEDYVYNKQK